MYFFPGWFYTYWCCCPTRAWESCCCSASSWLQGKSLSCSLQLSSSSCYSLFGSNNATLSTKKLAQTAVHVHRRWCSLMLFSFCLFWITERLPFSPHCSQKRLCQGSQAVTAKRSQTWCWGTCKLIQIYFFELTGSDYSQ